MEDAKKKKNRKKKNKQVKQTDRASAVGEAASMDQNHVVADQNHHHHQVSEGADVQNDSEIRTEADPHRHHDNGTERVVLEEMIKKLQDEKDLHIKKVASLEETIKKLQIENDAHIQKETSLEETIKQLHAEKDGHMQKEAGLEMRIAQIQCEKDLWLQKENSLQETIKQLHIEKDGHVQKEVGLETRNAQIQCEKDLWLQKEVRLEGQISQLLDEVATLSLEKTKLVEEFKSLVREKEAWHHQEKITKDSVAILEGNSTKLQRQVSELEESRNSLLQEKQHLAEKISSLQIQIQSLEGIKGGAENEELASQFDAACALVEKLVTENADLVEKVNELYKELDRRTVARPFSSVVGSNAMVGLGTSIAAYSDQESREIEPPSGEKTDIVSVKDELVERENGVDHSANIPVSLTDNSSGKLLDSEEIVQIQLDDSEVRNLEARAVENDKSEAVAFTDAPLIGAPFRLVSFVAKYVSGSDLVNRGS